MTAPIIVAERCPYCSKPRSPRDLLKLTAFTICHDCYQRHLLALDGLSTGRYTGSCSECGRSVAEITARQRDGDRGVRMHVHFENGIYRPMCLECSRAYVPKRADLYGDTAYWRQKN